MDLSSGINNLQIQEPEINMLNEDCMNYIFSYLTISERFHIEQVCQGWKTLLENSWSSYNELILKFDESSDHVLYRIFSTVQNDSKYLSRIISNILEKCGSYIKKIELSLLNHNGTSIILEQVEKKCENIENFILHGFVYKYECNENILSSIFLKNKNLKFLKLMNLQLTGMSFSSLHAEFIESLVLLECNDFEIKNVLKAFKNFKCLKKFALYSCKNLVEPAIKTLIAADCQISEFWLGGNIRTENSLDDYNDLLRQLFQKQKNLKIVNLQNVYINENSLLSLDAEKIKVLELVSKNINFKNWSSLFKNFQNLLILTMYLYDDLLNDQMFKAISYCQNLYKLRLVILTHPSLITLESKKYFNNLSNLTVLTINSYVTLTDSFLISIGECKNLKAILIENKCDYDGVTDVGMKAIASLPSLGILLMFNLNQITGNAFVSLKNTTVLVCSHCKNIKNLGLETVIKNCKNLEVLFVTGCEKLKMNSLLETAIEVKKVLPINATELKIAVSEDINVNRFKNLSPLVKISQGEFEAFKDLNYLKTSVFYNQI